MKTFLIGAGLLSLALLPAAPALADSNVLCVQQELASRGYDPGPLDGEIGPQTREAANAAGWQLTADNAATMCNDLRPVRTFSFTSPEPNDPPPFVERLEPQPTFNSAAPESNCPKYVINPDDPCF